jgi:hypothetical protein
MYSPPSSNGVYDSSANPTASADEFCQERGWDYPVGNPIIGSWEDGKREGGVDYLQLLSLDKNTKLMYMNNFIPQPNIGNRK